MYALGVTLGMTAPNVHLMIQIVVQIDCAANFDNPDGSWLYFRACAIFYYVLRTLYPKMP